MKRCQECVDGEHANYDNDIEKVVVLDENHRRVKPPQYMCGEHRTMYLDDGYILQKR
jgi:hypothetical protein